MKNYPRKTEGGNKAVDELKPFQPWQVAVFIWTFFPGGSSDLGEIKQLISKVEDDQFAPPGLLGGLRFVQQILEAKPSIAAEIEGVRGQIAGIMAEMKRIQPLWGLSGIMDPDVVLTVSKA